jgi:hypothetical protein
MRNNKKRSKTIMELAGKNLQQMGQWEIAKELEPIAYTFKYVYFIQWCKDN